MKRRIARFVRARLHRQLFVWLGISILGTGLAVSVAGWLFSRGGASPWRQMFVRAQTFVGGQLAETWDEPERRDRLLRDAARDFEMNVVLEDASGAPIATYGEACKRPDFWAPVMRDGALLGHVRVCGERGGPRAFVFFGVFGVVFLALWVSSGLIARRLVRPLTEVARVANAIGGGDLKARANLTRSKAGEIGALEHAINDMAERIERQMNDQRELLAAVSHEIRSPLSRMRVMLEIARERGAPESSMNDLEREIVEVNSLVGQLLASSRLDFAALELHALDAKDVATRSLERAGLGSELLACDEPATEIQGDPTLLARAIDNLLENAKKHGGGATSLRIVRRSGKLSFLVEDSGPGFAEADVDRVFESFVRGERSAGSSLGLGLALVRRIAQAHGGDAWAENRSEGGGRVGFSVSCPNGSPSSGPT